VVTYFTEPKMGQSYRLLVWPSAHILIRSMSVQKGLDERRRIFQQPTWSQSPRERSSCGNFFTVQRFRLVLFVSEYFQPYLETASRSMANRIVDVASLEATIDIKHLPRQDLSSEVYQ
jgi:hypothetical protein